MEPIDRADLRRFFVVTAGRTGSTLLASILADAGANFAFTASDDWDTARGGSLEHPEIRRATHHFRTAFERSPSKPRGLISRLIWTYHRTMGKRHLKRALEQATYVKALHLDLAIPFAIKLGYFPQVIVNYRPFGEQALSHSQMLINWSADAMTQTYGRIYRNSLLLLHSYGGCVVSYADLTERGRAGWATALSEITGFSADELLANRNRRAKATQAARPQSPMLDESAERSIAAIDNLSGVALAPSSQALRNWQRRMADGRSAGAPPISTPDEKRRAFPRGRPFAQAAQWLTKGRLPIEVEAMWRSIWDSRIPWFIRAIAPLCAVAYTIAPIDPIPNQIPIIGHLDDLIAAALLVALFIWLVPRSIMVEHRADAAERRGRRLALNR